MSDFHTLTDAKLVAEARLGSRDAFGEIVNRYRNLVCSLAFSRSGSLSSSEDLAQEAFVAAWQNLHQLREPDQLRAWLAGIVQRIGASHVRTWVRRRTLQPTESLDAAAETDGDGPPVEYDAAAIEQNPEHQAADEQESALVWKALAALPEKYRDPLVLFYREDQSVTAVARALGLADDAARQRLHRGRQLLRREMTQMIASTLERTVPTMAFTAAVMAALPAFAPTPAIASTVAVVGGAAKVGSETPGLFAAATSWPIVGPLVGLLLGIGSARLAASAYAEEEARSYAKRYATGIVIGVWIFSLLLAGVLGTSAASMSAGEVVLVVVGWTSVLLSGLWYAVRRMQKQLDVMQSKSVPLSEDGSARYLLMWRSKSSWLGMPWIDLCVSTHGTGRACGWIAVGDVALSPLLAIGGIGVAPVAMGGITVGIFSLSLLGVALGMVAFGSIAVGIWSWGFTAMGWESAVGIAAVAFDYAMGAQASAMEANSAAAALWFETLWCRPLVELFAVTTPFLIVVIAVAAGLRWWQVHRQPNATRV